MRFSEEPPSAGAASHVHFDEKLHDSVVMVTPEGDGNFMVKVCSWSCCCAFWKQADIVTLIRRKLRTVRTTIFSNGGAQHHGNSASACPRRSWSRCCRRPPDSLFLGSFNTSCHATKQRVLVNLRHQRPF